IELLSFEAVAKIEARKQAVREGANPRDVKFDFAKEIVGRFHGADAAEESATGFVARFRHGQLPDDLAEKIVQVPEGESGSSVVRVLKDSGLVPSANEAVR